MSRRISPFQLLSPAAARLALDTAIREAIDAGSAPSPAQTAAYEKVMDAFAAGCVPAARRLECVAMIIHGQKTRAYHFAVRIGAAYLRSTEGDPFIAVGHALIANHGMWTGGVVASTPQITLINNNFYITIPVMVNEKMKVCQVPVYYLAKKEGGGFYCAANVFIGNKAIASGVAATLLTAGKREDDMAEAEAALEAAGYNEKQRRAFFEHLTSATS